MCFFSIESKSKSPDQEVPVTKYPAQEENDFDDDYEEILPAQIVACTTASPMHYYDTAGFVPSATSLARPTACMNTNVPVVTGTLNKDSPKTRDMSKPMPTPKPSGLKPQLQKTRIEEGKPVIHE